MKIIIVGTLLIGFYAFIIIMNYITIKKAKIVRDKKPNKRLYPKKPSNKTHNKQEFI